MQQARPLKAVQIVGQQSERKGGMGAYGTKRAVYPLKNFKSQSLRLA